MKETTGRSSEDRNTHRNNAISALRVAHQYQEKLLLLADLKASIAMGIVAVLIVFVLVQVNIPGDISLNAAPAFALFFLFEGAAFLLAMMVIMPRTIRDARLSRIEDAPNPLFFGFFTQFSEDEFVSHMESELSKPDKVEKIFLKDLYQLGQALKSKYALLRWCYLAAAGGVIIPFGPTIYLMFIRPLG
ncbi:MAG: Pycsar system effector family protein [Gammaproteobacteria bacterium]